MRRPHDSGEFPNGKENVFQGKESKQTPEKF